MVKENGGIKIEEMNLFHGTKREYLEAIIRKGVDFRVNTRHVYGKGK